MFTDLPAMRVNNYWFGLYDDGTNYNWVWTDGSPTDYFSWHDGKGFTNLDESPSPNNLSTDI